VQRIGHGADAANSMPTPTALLPNSSRLECEGSLHVIVLECARHAAAQEPKRQQRLKARHRSATAPPRGGQMLFEGVTTRDGVLSSWNGQRPMRSAPLRVKITPRASARCCTETSALSCSITPSGMRATPPCLQSARNRRARLTSDSTYFGPSVSNSAHRSYAILAYSQRHSA
jgi:hypothetical protein